MVGDAVVAPQHHRGHESHQLFGLGIQRARLVRPGVQREEPIDVEVARRVDCGVHLVAKMPELLDVPGVGHGRSDGEARCNLERGKEGQ